MAAAGALYFTAGEIGGVSGPVIVGILADHGGFDPAVALLVAVSLIMATLAWSLRASVDPAPT